VDLIITVNTIVKYKLYFETQKSVLANVNKCLLNPGKPYAFLLGSSGATWRYVVHVRLSLPSSLPPDAPASPLSENTPDPPLHTPAALVFLSPTQLGQIEIHMKMKNLTF
jgi:hypothetical protein